MIRILLVDDQELVRSGFRTILNTEPGFEVVGEAMNGEEAVRMASALTPDVICMDVEMPVMNGIEAARTILAERDTPVLMLTTFGHEQYLFEALAAGVRGFLLKTSRAEQLIEAVHTLAAGEALLGSDVTVQVLERLQSGEVMPTRHVAHPASEAPAAASDFGFTERETQVLQLLALGQSNGEIAAALFLGESTVKTHVSNILRKLGARDRIQAIVWAHTNGFAGAAER